MLEHQAEPANWTWLVPPYQKWGVIGLTKFIYSGGRTSDTSTCSNLVLWRWLRLCTGPSWYHEVTGNETTTSRGVSRHKEIDTVYAITFLLSCTEIGRLDWISLYRYSHNFLTPISVDIHVRISQSLSNITSYYKNVMERYVINTTYPHFTAEVPLPEVFNSSVDFSCICYSPAKVF